MRRAGAEVAVEDHSAFKSCVVQPERVFVAVEDSYAKEAVPRLLYKLGVAGRVDVRVEVLRPCSGEMARILRAALMDYGRVVLVDAGDRRPEDVEREVAERRLSGGGGRGLVVAARPSIEEWACHALRLEVCATSLLTWAPLGP